MSNYTNNKRGIFSNLSTLITKGVDTCVTALEAVDELALGTKEGACAIKQVATAGNIMATANTELVGITSEGEKQEALAELYKKFPHLQPENQANPNDV